MYPIPLYTDYKKIDTHILLLLTHSDTHNTIKRKKKKISDSKHKRVGNFGNKVFICGLLLFITDDMSIQQAKKRPFYPSIKVLLLFIFLLILQSQKHNRAVVAIRLFPEEEVVDQLTEPAPPSGKKRHPHQFFQTQRFRDYFKTRQLSTDLNITTPSNATTFFDDKRIIPSCPDPLHN